MYILKKSTKKEKKLMITTPEGKTIHFGSSLYASYPNHKDKLRKELYLIRHKGNENWTNSGINTAGFWSRYLLWNKPTLKESIRDTERIFDIDIQYLKN